MTVKNIENKISKETYDLSDLKNINDKNLKSIKANDFLNVLFELVNENVDIY